MGSYLILLRVGFAVPLTVTSNAVCSYHTVSPLPAYSSQFDFRRCWLRLASSVMYDVYTPSTQDLPPSLKPNWFEYLSRWRFIFCCTFRRLSPPRRYLAPCSVEPGLSSLVCTFQHFLRRLSNQLSGHSIRGHAQGSNRRSQ